MPPKKTSTAQEKTEKDFLKKVAEIVGMGTIDTIKPLPEPKPRTSESLKRYLEHEKK